VKRVGPDIGERPPCWRAIETSPNLHDIVANAAPAEEITRILDHTTNLKLWTIMARMNRTMAPVRLIQTGYPGTPLCLIASTHDLFWLAEKNCTMLETSQDNLSRNCP
jgi:hypothetical protein